MYPRHFPDTDVTVNPDPEGMVENRMGIPRLVERTQPLCVILLFLLTLAGGLVSARADALDNWQWRNPLPQGSTLSCIAYGNGNFVATGTAGTILESPDGINWTSANTGPTTLSSVAYVNGIFMAVGNSGAILTSSNGLTWTSQNSGNTRDLSSTTYNNGLFVVVGDFGTILTSPDGVNWSGRNSGTAYNLYGVTDGNNTFVAAGDSGTILTSTDGATWTASSSGTTVVLNAVTYGGSTFVAVGDNNTVLTSSDGLSWTPEDAEFYDDISYVTYGNGIFIAIDQYGDILVSPDGVSWYSGDSGLSGTPSGVAYGNGTFVAVGTDSEDNKTGAMWTSPDGKTWTARNSAITYDGLEAVAYGNGTFVTVGEDAIMTSLDGVSWMEANSGYDLYGVAFGGGTSVAVGSYVILTSSAEVNWTHETLENSALFQGITYGGGIFVTVGQDGTIETSTNGTTWTNYNSGFNYNLTGVTYGNNIFVAVGYGQNGQGTYGTTVSSTDGVTWTPTILTATSELSGIACTNGTFVAVGTNGTILSSTDGQTWNKSSSGTTNNLSGITSGNGIFIATGSNGALLSSTDGATWTSRNPGVATPQELNGIGYGYGTFVALGNNGTILQSQTLEGIGPVTTTETATGFTSMGATLNGIVNPNGGAATASFEYSTSPTLAGAAITSGTNIGGGSSDILVSTPVTGLSPGQTYYFRVQASNVNGEQYGSIVALTTSPLPPVITSGTSVIGFNGSPFGYQITASNSPFNFNATGLPQGLTVNTSTGVISGTVNTTGTFSPIIGAVNTGGTGTATLAITILNPPIPVISSALTATGTEDFAFNYQIAASNGPASFDATGLPAGVGYSASTGLISGTPTVTGTFAATISAINEGGTGSKTLTLTVVPAPPAITSGLTASATNGLEFSYQITASNNPTSFNATGLPAGLTPITTSGYILGEPIVSGTFAVTISAINTGGTGSATLTLVVITPPGPAITSALSATGTSDLEFDYQITASNIPTSFGAGGLPPGVGFSASTGLISGIPTVAGTFAATMSAANAGGTDTEPFTVTILPPPPVITSSLTASGSNGSAFNYQITARNGPASFNATGLPTGLSVNTSTGLISGTLATSGTFATTISATNAGGTGSATLALTVNVDFDGVKGSYDGLAAAGGTNVGLFTVSLTSKGDFTGKLTLAGAHFPLKGTFSTYGTFNGPVGAGADALDVALTVEPSLPGVSGSITATTGGGINYSVESSLLGKFNASTLPSGLEGKYTAIIPVESGTDPTLPQAPGYGTMSVTTKGAIHIAGKLGDGTAFSAGGQLHADGKTWTLFKPLYGRANPGSIAGEMTFESEAASDCDGTVDWIKPAQASGSYYSGGFSVSTDLLAAKYVAPPLASGTAGFTLGGGNLPDSAITDSLLISFKDKVTVSGVNNGSVTVTSKASTGAFSGKFAYPGTNKKTSFSGVIYQKPTPAGFGLFLGTDQSGGVGITP